MFLFGLGIFPNLVFSNPHPEFSLSIYNASSSIKTLQTMLAIALIGMPLVLAYTIGIYWIFRGKVIKIDIPIKMDFEVIDAPPAIKGNTAQGGTKLVTVANGVKISAPLFVNIGDIIRINTQTRMYVERVDKK